MTRDAKKKAIMVFFSVFIFAITLLPYLQTSRFEFLNYDDNDYVYATPEVTNGLSWASVRWAFTDTAEKTSNWHPLTFLSLMTDVSLFGVKAGPMHLHNAVLHACNAVGVFLLMLVILRILGSGGGSGVSETAGPGYLDVPFLAALFGALFWALHPLRVESVAWVASRKDVLSVFWFLFGAMAFLRKTAEREWLEVAVLAGYALAFMGKPTAIIFPAILLLLEYALKRRIRWRDMGGYFLFALIFAVVTICAQKAVISKTMPLILRAMNAVASVGDYLVSTLYPVGLSVFYPYERPIPATRMVKGVLALLLITHALWTPMIAFVRRHPPVVVSGKGREIGETAGLCDAEEGDQLVRGLLLGFGWFFAALIPVIGIVHVGIASHADRYTYLSGIGLSIVITVSVELACRHMKQLSRISLLVGGVLVLLILGILSGRQIRYWRDSETLFRHAIAVTHENHIGHCNLAAALFEQKRYDEAFVHCRLLAAQGYQEIAIPRLEIMMAKLKGMECISNRTNLLEYEIDDKADPLAAQKYHALGLIANDRNLHSAAEAFARKSLALVPDDGYVLELLGSVLYKQQRYGEALAAMEEAKRLLPKRRPIATALRVIARKAVEPEDKRGNRKNEE